MKDKAAAIVIIHRANEMTARGRRAIAAWLRRQADALVKDGKRYARRFTGRYLYRVLPLVLLLTGCAGVRA